MSPFGLLIATWSPQCLAVEPPEATPVEQRQLLDEIRALRREVAELRKHKVADGDRVSFGRVLIVGEDETVAEAVAFRDNVAVHGEVIGDALSFGGNVVIKPTGQVHGDAISVGGRVEVEEGGQLHGDRIAVGLPVSMPTVAVAMSDPAGVANLRLASDASEILASLYRRLVWMCSIAGAGVLVVGLFPQRVTRVANDLETRPVRAAVVGTLVTGFLTLFSVLFAIVTLGLGSPVSLLLIGMLGLAWLLGFVGLCQAVGDRLPVRERPHGRWIAFLVGVVLLTFLGSLPWVGWLVVGGASVLGIGAALSTRFGRP